MDENQSGVKSQSNSTNGQTTQPPCLANQPVGSSRANLPPQKPAANILGKVMLVEDDPTMVKMYSTKLGLEGFAVEIACDGEEGLKKIKELLPDLVVLDLMIPKMGGMEVLEQLRADPKTKSLPVIVLSNLSQEQDIQRSHQLGVSEFLIKANFTPGQVVEKIKSILNKG